jgi:hypothetical protein
MGAEYLPTEAFIVVEFKVFLLYSLHIFWVVLQNVSKGDN